MEKIGVIHFKNIEQIQYKNQNNKQVYFIEMVAISKNGFKFYHKHMYRDYLDNIYKEAMMDKQNIFHLVIIQAKERQ